jgi:hypothetical protein
LLPIFSPRVSVAEPAGQTLVPVAVAVAF